MLLGPTTDSSATQRFRCLSYRGISVTGYKVTDHRGNHLHVLLGTTTDCAVTQRYRCDQVVPG